MLGRDGIAGLVCLAGSLGLLALTRGLPRSALVPIGAGFYPRIVLVVTALFSALLIVSDVRARRHHPAAAPEAGRRAPRAASRNYRLVALTFVVFTAYVFALPVLGYRAATVCFVLALQLLLQPAGRRPWVRIVAVALVTAVITHLVFESYLSVLLPRGRWTGF